MYKVSYKRLDKIDSFFIAFCASENLFETREIAIYIRLCLATKGKKRSFLFIVKLGSRLINYLNDQIEPIYQKP